jgi:NAD-dependent dihydropyrimidine dehydrogenase PreA subunit
MSEPRLPAIDTDLCTACGVCVEVCPAGALAMNQTGPYFSAPTNCSYCTDCEALCPTGAITCDFEIGWGSEIDLNDPSIII